MMQYTQSNSVNGLINSPRRHEEYEEYEVFFGFLRVLRVFVVQCF